MIVRRDSTDGIGSHWEFYSQLFEAVEAMLSSNWSGTITVEVQKGRATQFETERQKRESEYPPR